MTPDELERGAALLAAATPGPWTHQRGQGHLSMSHTIRDAESLPIAEMWHTAENKSAENGAAVAWLRTNAADLIALARQAQDNAKVLAALVELVACKDLKDTPVLKMTKETELRRMDYERRKPLAWEAARAAIAAATPGKAAP